MRDIPRVHRRRPDACGSRAGWQLIADMRFSTDCLGRVFLSVAWTRFVAMFDTMEDEALARVAGIVDAMRGAVAIRVANPHSPGSPATITELDRVETIEGLEQVVRIAQGLQAGHGADLFDAFDTDHRLLFCRDNRPYHSGVEDESVRVTGHETAAARRVSPLSGQAQTRAALLVCRRHPHTWAAVVAGQVGYNAATRAAYACMSLPDDVCRELDELIALDAVRLTPGKLEKSVLRRVIKIDPAAAEKRARRARTQKSITLVTQHDSMATLEGYLPAEQALACYLAIENHALGLKADGDTRTIKDLLCDTFVERLTGLARADKPTIELGLVTTLNAHAGPGHGGTGCDEPATLRGYGPIPAGLARDLANSANTFLRKLTTDSTGTVTGISDRRFYTDTMKAFFGYRDQTCAYPGCDRPVQEGDHLTDYADGGETSSENGQGLCKPHNLFKTHPKITAVREPDGTVTWTLPSGARYPTRPPPALGYG